MTNIKSQEQTIYRALAAQIQMGFFDDETPFPSVMEIAQQYGASYCPAQRALKMLERDGIIKINRKKSSVIISKPYPDYLTSGVFMERAASLEDLNKTLELISPAVCFYILSRLDDRLTETAGSECENTHCARQLYGSFFRCSSHAETRPYWASFTTFTRLPTALSWTSFSKLTVRSRLITCCSICWLSFRNACSHIKAKTAALQNNTLSNSAGLFTAGSLRILNI